LRAGRDFSLWLYVVEPSPRVTEKHYAYLLKENLREAADRIDLGLGLPKPAAKVVAIDRSRRV